MKWLKKLFGLEEEQKQEEVSEPIEEEKLRSDGKPWRECSFCHKMINEGDRWSKQQGQWFHRACYKSLLRRATG